MSKQKSVLDQGDPKEEIERMYRMAYCVDPGFFRPADVVDLGLDVVRLKEFGQVRMRKNATLLKRQAGKLWERMSEDQRAAYTIADILSCLGYIGEAMAALEGYLGPLPGAQEELDMVYNALFTKIPLQLQSKLAKGFGKWKSGGKA